MVNAIIEKKRTRRKKTPFSVHVTADFFSPIFIECPRKVRRILYKAAEVANNTPLKCSIHKFPVQGITGVLILAESHIAIHTWPEYGYIAIDLFTCGKETKPIRALEYLQEVFQPKEVKIRHIRRGGQ